MKKIKPSSRYKKDIKKLDNSLINELKDILDILVNDLTLDPKYNNHKLKGNYINYYELHVKPDLLLIYKINEEDNQIYLTRIGSHSELFKK